MHVLHGGHTHTTHTHSTLHTRAQRSTAHSACWMAPRPPSDSGRFLAYCRLVSCCCVWQCVKRADKYGLSDAVSVQMDQQRFVFSVETNGSLAPEQIVMMALEELQRKLQGIATEINTTVKKDEKGLY